MRRAGASASFYLQAWSSPAPLRSDAKVPLRSGLCDMNDIVDEIEVPPQFA